MPNQRSPTATPQTPVHPNAMVLIVDDDLSIRRSRVVEKLGGASILRCLSNSETFK